MSDQERRAPASILLRVFSGPHIGAELPLMSGTWVVGAEDSCDLIFHDTSLAPRHAALTVRESAQGPELTYEPLDGNARLEGEDAAPGPLPPQTAFCIGQTVLAWIPAGDATASQWEPVVAAVTRNMPPRQETSPAGTAAPEEPPVREKPVAPLTLGAGPASPKDPSASAEPTRRPRLLWLLLGLFLVSGLLVTVDAGDDGRERSAAKLNDLLRREGFGTLTVQVDARGLALSGILADDAERARLQNLLQRLHFPVYLAVSVRNDRTRAIEQAFAIRGLFPEVREAERDGESVITVSGYMRDGVVEEWAFSGLYGDVPGIALLPGKPEAAPVPAAIRVERNIAYAQAVDAILRPALAREKLGAATVNYLPGSIAISGSFDPDQRMRLALVFAETQRALGVPVTLDLREAPPLQAKAQPDTAPATKGRPLFERAAATAEPGKPLNFPVVGITMQPLRFISLKNGERVFEGGILGNGWIVEHIAVDALKLQKDGQTTVYPLRGGL